MTDMNTKTLQGVKFQVMRGQVMGISMAYDDDVERRTTYYLLMQKIEHMSLSWDGDTEDLKKDGLVVPVRAGV